MSWLGEHGRGGRASFLLALGLLASFSACGGSSSSDGMGSSTPQDCADYLTAYCGHRAFCNLEDEAACEARLGGIVCIQSSEVASCATAYTYLIQCGVAPTGCNLNEVSDLPKTEAICRSFVSTACNYYLQCGTYADESSCESGLKTQKQIDCSRALGSSTSLPTCAAALPDAACGAEPSSCANVLTFTSP